uniref:Uncharacterized protein n=1 Tax=Onchocerca volvulus TaxID=6282 RepID=A0A8R1TW05_ONCVO
MEHSCGRADSSGHQILEEYIYSTIPTNNPRVYVKTKCFCCRTSPANNVEKSLILMKVCIGLSQNMLHDMCYWYIKL